MRTAGLLFLIALLTAPGCGEDPLLVRLLSCDEAIRDRADAEWQALDEEQRFRVALARLRSDDDEVAWFCADRLDPLRLNLEELRLR
ncbi:MAG: hypothetical protein ACYS99_08490, partial [Planctomycetota bacterium]